MTPRMNRFVVFTLLSLFAATAVVPAEAVIGRGRSSMGSRGNRGWSQPSRPSSPSQSPWGAPAPSPRPYPSPSGGGFLKNLGAGIAGGFLGAMLFRAMGMPGGPGGGFGLLEILLLVGVAFLAFRWFRSRSAEPVTAAGPVGGESYIPPSREAAWTPQPATVGDEAPADVLAASELDFDEKRFREARLDDFFRAQAAFGSRDLGPIRDKLAVEIAPELEADVAELRRSGQVNRMENIAVRSTELTDAWREPGRLYATIRFEANVIDYTLDERTGQVVSGSREQSTKFQERWTFVRETGFGKGEAPWKLSAIEREA